MPSSFEVLNSFLFSASSIQDSSVRPPLVSVGSVAANDIPIVYLQRRKRGRSRDFFSSFFLCNESLCSFGVSFIYFFAYVARV